MDAAALRKRATPQRPLQHAFSVMTRSTGTSSGPQGRLGTPPGPAKHRGGAGAPGSETGRNSRRRAPAARRRARRQGRAPPPGRSAPARPRAGPWAARECRGGRAAAQTARPPSKASIWPGSSCWGQAQGAPAAQHGLQKGRGVRLFGAAHIAHHGAGGAPHRQRLEVLQHEPAPELCLLGRDRQKAGAPGARYVFVAQGLPVAA